jgi:hypothetical protein
MSTLKFTEYVLPSNWASALINADESGMTEEDITEMNQYLDFVKPGFCVGCSDESEFMHRCDADVMPCDCLTYTFQEV